MDFVTVRELRAESAKVWEKIEAGEDVVVTRNGKPFALLTATEPQRLEEDMRVLRQVRARRALESMWQHAKEAGLDKLNQEEINAEIAAARAERAAHKAADEAGH